MLNENGPILKQLALCKSWLMSGLGSLRITLTLATRCSQNPDSPPSGIRSRLVQDEMRPLVPSYPTEHKHLLRLLFTNRFIFPCRKSALEFRS